jgi:hypothetical protein
MLLVKKQSTKPSSKKMKRRGKLLEVIEMGGDASKYHV